MNKKFTLFVVCALMLSSFYIINAQTALQTIAINTEEQFFTIDKTSDYSVSNYSYPSFYTFNQTRNNTLEPYAQIVDSLISRTGCIETFIPNGFYSDNPSYGISRNYAVPTDPYIASFTPTEHYILGGGNIGDLDLGFDMGLKISNLSSYGRLLTMYKMPPPTGISLTVDLTASHLIIFLFDGIDSNVSIPYLATSLSLRMIYNTTALDIYINDEFNQTLACSTMITTNNAYISVNAYLAISGISGNFHQFHVCRTDLRVFNITLPDLNPIFNESVLESKIVSNLISYKGTQFSFLSNTTIPLTGAYNFQAGFVCDKNVSIRFISSFNLTTEFNFNTREIEYLREGVLIHLNQSFSLITVNRSAIAIYNQFERIYYFALGSLLPFNELSFIFNSSVYCYGWNSDYPFRITPADNIDSLTYSLFCVYQSQPLRRTNEFFDPIMGLLTSQLTPFYGNINYTNQNFTQMYDSDLFISDTTIFNTHIYLKNNSNYSFLTNGKSGKIFINWDEQINQSRNYFRLVFSYSTQIYKAQLSYYDLNQSIVHNRIVESIYPLQFHFSYDNLTNILKCTNLNEDVFSTFSNYSISIKTESNMKVHVMDELPYAQTWSTSNYTRESIQIAIQKDFNNYFNQRLLLSEKLMNIDVAFEIVNSQIKSAGTYVDIENQLNNQYFKLDSKITHTVGLVADKDKVIARYLYSHLTGLIENDDPNAPLASLLYGDLSRPSWINKLWNALFVREFPQGYEPYEEEVKETWFYEQTTNIFSLDFEGIISALQSGILSIVSTISNVLTDFIEVLSSMFYTLTQDLLSDMVSFSDSFESLTPSENVLTVAFVSQSFLTNDITTFKLIFTTEWLLTEVLDGQSVLSFFIGLGVSLLIMLTIPITVHHLKHNPVLTYVSCLISVLVCIIIGMLDLGIGLVAMFFASVLLIFKLKANKGAM